jgi:16S rRNA (cytosine967-C5)-methyltransferase
VSAPSGISSREVALRTVSDVFGPQSRGAQAAFDYRAREAKLDARDRAFAAELTYGSIKMRRALDAALAPYIADRAAPLPPTIHEVLRLGFYQLRFMGGVDRHAAVYETVELAKRHGHKGTAGLVNAVMRRYIADAAGAADSGAGTFAGDEALAVAYSLPTWMVARIRSTFGDAAEAICAGLDAPAQQAVRVNTARIPVNGAAAALENAGCSVERSAFVGESLIVTSAVAGDDPQGRWSVQSEASAMPVDLLDPRPGETVLDLCCGRGNKSMQIAARMGGAGTLVCVDQDARKLTAWRGAAERLGLPGAALVEARVEAFEPAGPAGAVLLDAPCSGIGTIGRHAEARWRKSPEDAGRLAAAQSALLRRAASFVAPGGRLVYAVCSFDPREGVDVVGAFLSEAPAFRRGPLPERYGAFERSGDVLVPPGLQGRDGFYIALLERAVSGP